MISVEKAYYSSNTNQIHLALYNSSPDSGTFSELISAISIFKSSSSGEYRYTATWNVVEFDEVSPGVAAQCHVYINTEDIEPVLSSYPVFDPSGIIRVEISSELNSNSILIIDQSDLYQYKMKIINGEMCSDCDIRYSKKLSRFSFYERMLFEAAESGFTQDAYRLYDELKKMAEYGIPTVKRVNQI